MIKKILIANRGEIALRILRSSLERVFSTESFLLTIHYLPKFLSKQVLVRFLLQLFEDCGPFIELLKDRLMGL